MDSETTFLIVKILVTVGSLVTLYLFRRSISKLICDVLIGQDTGGYTNTSVSEIITRIDEKLDRVLK